MLGSLLILGRHPTLSIVEIESLYSNNHIIELINPQIARIDMPASEINFSRLGGILKVSELISVNKNSQDLNILFEIIKKITEDLTENTSSKINLGISSYGLNINLNELNQLKLKLKKHLRTIGKSIRLIPNDTLDLSTAQTYHNKLDLKNNIELIITYKNSSYFIARVTNVQDINEYSFRDRNRPKRDTRVGMLPPKLAQIMINLASGDFNNGSASRPRLLDPFCGTGVVLQEALLMNYDVIGTDISPKMIDYSNLNIEWLREKFKIDSNLKSEIYLGDATNIKWVNKPNIVVSEIYLGPPITTMPSLNQIKEFNNDCQTILKKFLINLHSQIPKGTQICLAIPAWSINKDYLRLSLVDHLDEIGYNQKKFIANNNRPLIYHRPHQFVARELVVLRTI